MKDSTTTGQTKKLLDPYTAALITAFVCILLICFIMVSKSKSATNTITKTETQIMYDINDPFSEQKVRDYLIELKVKYPNVAIAQMKLESANGTSNIFRQNNNLFGMKQAGRRPTTALGTRNNHAYYSHWRMSVVDYAIYQAYFMNSDNITSEGEWLNFVGQMYAEDQSYKQKLISRIKHKS